MKPLLVTWLQITLKVAPALEDYGLSDLQLGLGGEHQRINAALAVALCKQWVMTRPPSELHDGLKKVTLQSTMPVLSFFVYFDSYVYLNRMKIFRIPARDNCT